ncbi:hypothetical protein [Streptobacillus moniliformis]|uniref:hypothetical protein n=1 Tax=Streptobacillus moniliformis TaxID=34105 RepID=UPI000A9BA9D8|nr:hypothetical protein [Streptobacillus moniliformis]
MYNSIEAFVGLSRLLVIDFKDNKDYNKYIPVAQENFVIKIAYGVKFNDKYNAALYTG